ncbi:hypothetical protein ACFZBE_40415 [Streptomyces sp. NPDC008061]|uniref:hypothetical protein n=1 Tax=Streptomyces sp. NPDC008061 TaxID=3364805 RepID=UPI0036E4AEA9
MEGLDLLEPAADLVAENDAELTVGGLQVLGVDVGCLDDCLLYFVEVVLLDDIVLGKLFDAATELVGLVLEVLVLGYDLEGGDLAMQAFDLGLGQCDLAT